MRNLFVYLLSLAFVKGNERSKFIETTKSDFHYSKAANASGAYVAFGAVAQSARSLLQNSFNLGFLFITMAILGITYSHSSNLGDISIWLFFIPVLLNSFTWAIYISELNLPLLAVQIFLGTGSWVYLSTNFGQEQSLACYDCENNFIQKQLPEIGQFSQFFILIVLAIFLQAYLSVIFRLLASHLLGIAVSFGITFIIEAIILAQFLAGTNFIDTSESSWIVLSHLIPTELAPLIYIVLFLWFTASSIILALKFNLLKSALRSK